MSVPAAAWLAYLRRMPLLLFLVLYTIVSGGPFLWVASMSLRTTPEIFANPYALPSHPHWEKFVEAWTRSRSCRRS
jgi:ABC-type glycerol-3-phosphate transport system permease component